MSTALNSVAVFGKEIEGLFKEIAVDEGICDYTFKTNVGSEKGDGYASIITIIDISGKDLENKNKTVHLIMKSAKTEEALRAEGDMGAIFIREMYLYDTVLPSFGILEKENSLAISSFGPKFYKGTATYGNEALIFENLRASGYSLYERRIPMDEAHVRLVVEQYGRLHSLSFALRDKNPAKFKKIVGEMDDIFIKMLVDMDAQSMFIQKCVKAKEVLDPKTQMKAIQVYDEFVQSIKQFFSDLPLSVDQHSVILHGDCWTNNMMFKYEDKNNPTKPTNVTFIDFQCSRMGSPVVDLSYFFYACGSKKIFDNLNHYMKLYYNSFSTHLRKLGSDPDKLYPYSVFQQHWKQFSRYGLIFSIMVIHVMLTEKDETIDIGKVAEAGLAMKDAFDYEIANAATYNNRVRDIILHFVEHNFI